MFISECIADTTMWHTLATEICNSITFNIELRKDSHYQNLLWKLTQICVTPLYLFKKVSNKEAELKQILSQYLSPEKIEALVAVYYNYADNTVEEILLSETDNFSNIDDFMREVA